MGQFSARRGIDRARHLLATTDRQIKRNAIETGFASPMVVLSCLRRSHGFDPRASTAPRRKLQSRAHWVRKHGLVRSACRLSAQGFSERYWISRAQCDPVRRTHSHALPSVHELRFGPPAFNLPTTLNDRARRSSRTPDWLWPSVRCDRRHLRPGRTFVVCFGFGGFG